MPHGEQAFRRREPLSDHTTFGIGGPARFWYEPTPGELPAVVDFAKRASLPVLVLGDGSNCLVSDAGFDGLVIRLACGPPNIVEDHGSDVIVSAGAGVPWDMLVDWCCVNGLQGIECMAGIPGTVGGAVAGAIGAYGQQVADVVEWVDEFRVFGGDRIRHPRSTIAFGYRWSEYQIVDSVIILRAGFRLRRGHAPHRAHRDAATITPVTGTLVDFAAGIRRIRERKGAMLWVPGRGINRTAGSFFKNPTVAVAAFEPCILAEHPSEAGTWWWPSDTGIRVSAAFLIEQAGFVKGYRRGNAAISPEHTLSLVNLGGATADELIALAREIRDRVFDRYRVRLRPEVRMIGFTTPPLP